MKHCISIVVPILKVTKLADEDKKFPYFFTDATL